MTAWQLSISEADIPLPTAEQSIPPITLVGGIVQLVPPASSTTGAQGQFTIRTQPLTGTPTASGLPPMQMDIATTELPMEWYSLVKRRLPSMPIDKLTGGGNCPSTSTNAYAK